MLYRPVLWAFIFLCLFEPHAIQSLIELHVIAGECVSVAFVNCSECCEDWEFIVLLILVIETLFEQLFLSHG